MNIEHLFPAACQSTKSPQSAEAPIEGLYFDPENPERPYHVIHVTDVELYNMLVKLLGSKEARKRLGKMKPASKKEIERDDKLREKHGYYRGPEKEPRKFKDLPMKTKVKSIQIVKNSKGKITKYIITWVPNFEKAENVKNLKDALIAYWAKVYLQEYKVPHAFSQHNVCSETGKQGYPVLSILDHVFKKEKPFSAISGEGKGSTEITLETQLFYLLHWSPMKNVTAKRVYQLLPKEEASVVAAFAKRYNKKFYNEFMQAMH